MAAVQPFESEPVWDELAAIRAALARLIELRAIRNLSPAEEAGYLAQGRREAELLHLLG
jgi:hypothetical protein